MIMCNDKLYIVASEQKDPICHSNECQIGSFSSQATICYCGLKYGEVSSEPHNNSSLRVDSKSALIKAFQMCLQELPAKPTKKMQRKFKFKVFISELLYTRIESITVMTELKKYIMAAYP